MNSFRQHSTTLKLMSLSWRKPLPLTRLSPVFSVTTNEASSRIIRCHYSSVTNPREDNQKEQSSQGSDSVDPFGIGEVVDPNDKSSILVQGFYGRTSETKPPTHTDANPVPVPASAPVPSQNTPPSTSTQTQEDPEKQSRLALYNNWIRQRVNLEASQKSEIGVSESYREAHYGQVRVDSENPVYSHGHYDEKFVLNEPPRGRRPRRQPSTSTSKDNEPITETIEADHSVRIRASDFLKKYRAESQSTSGGAKNNKAEEEEVDPNENIVIERIMHPRDNPSMEYASDATSDEGLTMDSNVIPKPYLLTDYNAITELDMWNVLKKSILFQNDFLLAINKPSGIPVHSKSRDCRHTVIQFLKKFADLTKCEEVYPLHRIDKETTGVLLFAKDKKVASIIKEKFANREIEKVYLGVTKLCPSVREGSIKIPIGEGRIPGAKNKYRRVLRPDLREFGIKPTIRGGVEAITNYKVINSIKEASFVEISPVTGYKHQIRVHFGMGLGCPIIGDHKYSHRDRMAPQRLHPYLLHKIKLKQSKVRKIPLHLHCNKIGFTLPKEYTDSTEPIYIHAHVPFYMKYTLKRLGLIR